jgi:hypothetical protein
MLRADLVYVGDDGRAKPRYTPPFLKASARRGAISPLLGLNPIVAMRVLVS